MNDDIKILYVEDETPIRKLYTPFIKEKASELYVAENGLERAQTLQKTQARFNHQRHPYAKNGWPRND